MYKFNYMETPLFVRLTADEHLGCFQLLAFLEKCCYEILLRVLFCFVCSAVSEFLLGILSGLAHLFG